MSEYKLYFLDESGHINSAMDLDCCDDRAAISAAHSFIGKHGAELWQHARKVAEIGPRHRQGTSRSDHKAQSSYSSIMRSSSAR